VSSSCARRTKAAFGQQLDPKNLSLHLIEMPAHLSRPGTELATLHTAGKLKPAMSQFQGKAPASVADMNPSNPFLKALYSLPLADNFKGKTIIGVLGDGPIEESDDSVVANSGAHLPGMESEDIVRGDHGEVLQSPVTVECIRRILLQNSRAPVQLSRPNELTVGFHQCLAIEASSAANIYMHQQARRVSDSVDKVRALSRSDTGMG